MFPAKSQVILDTLPCWRGAQLLPARVWAAHSDLLPESSAWKAVDDDCG